MDNDDFRRGIPTNHKKFNEATAILAGDSLLTYAFEILADESTHQNATTRCELIKTLAKASGFMGMAGGQMIDLETAQQKISKEKLLHLHRLKTGELFIASAKMGAILGNATIEEKSALQNFAHDFGLAFQIKDDILDHQEAGKNESLENASIVDLLGLKEAEQQLELLKNQANSHLKIFGESASLLQELFNFMANRLK
jgi:farnesyl diphosphate synthase